MLHPACGALLCFYHSALHGNLFSGPAANIGVAYYAVAITLNILVTSMSYIQVRTHGQRSQEQSGCGISRQLFGAASFIVEPALPRAVIGLVFLITFALDNGASVAFLSLYVMLTVGVLRAFECTNLSSSSVYALKYQCFTLLWNSFLTRNWKRPLRPSVLRRVCGHPRPFSTPRTLEETVLCPVLLLLRNPVLDLYKNPWISNHFPIE